MRTFLVTGGAGFIGSHLVDKLLGRGDGVRVLDDLSTGNMTNLDPGAVFAKGDIADPDAVAAAIEGVDGVFHLAAVASVERGNLDWAGTHRSNLSGAVVVFEAAARRGLPVVYASSAAVYGDNPSLPLAEDAVPRPLSAYGADKLGCELHARVGGIVHGLRSTGLRFFNVYGPRQDPKSPYSGVVSIFADRLRAGEGIAIYGDGEQTRDFVYVADVATALVAAMARAEAAPSGDAAIVNVCTGRPTSVNRLAGALGRLCGVNLRVENRPARNGDVRASLGDPSRLRDLLGVTASTPLEDGLAALLDRHAAP